MKQHEVALTMFAVGLGAIYAMFFTDWFTKKSIQIVPMIRPGEQSAIPREPGSLPVYKVAFRLNGRYELTSIKVVEAREFATNRFATPLWHMVADSKPLWHDSFWYGLKIPGMKAAVPRSRPQALEPGVSYLLLVEAGKLKGQTNFTTREAIPLRAR